ncbi:hypothetical protein ACQ4WX_44315 [Streptomyces lasalocidi]
MPACTAISRTGRSGLSRYTAPEWARTSSIIEARASDSTGRAATVSSAAGTGPEPGPSDTPPPPRTAARRAPGTRLPRGSAPRTASAPVPALAVRATARTCRGHRKRGRRTGAPRAPPRTLMADSPRP